MRSMSRATRALVGLVLCGVVAAIVRVARHPSKVPSQAKSVVAPVACPQRMAQVAPPRCETVDLETLIELKILPHGLHPQEPSAYYDGGDFRLGNDGVVRRSISFGSESGCASRGAMLAFVRRVEQFVPASAWRVLEGSEYPPSDWHGGVARPVRVVRVTRSGTTVADVVPPRELDESLAAFVAQNPSHEQRAREQFERSTAPAAVYSGEWVICGHCGNGSLNVAVREDGWFVYDLRDYHHREQIAGRFEPTQARAFHACLRARGALQTVPHYPDEGPVWSGDCATTSVWRDATGFDFDARLGSCTTYAQPAAQPFREYE